MNKAVMISIHPKWCALIADGRKTVEIRTTRPKIEPPFKCYIYETQASTKIPRLGGSWYITRYGCGAIIGEFICDRISPFFALLGGSIPQWDDADLDKSCVTREEIVEYIGRRDGFAWHISDLTIYHHPKELGRFVKPFCEHWQVDGTCISKKLCNERSIESNRCYCFGWIPIQKPPQSWCYCGGLLTPTQSN